MMATPIFKNPHFFPKIENQQEGYPRTIFLSTDTISDIKDLIRIFDDLIKVIKDMRNDLCVDLRSLTKEYTYKLWEEEQ